MIYRLKDDIEPSILRKYNLVPQYDVDTGKIFEYINYTTDKDNYRDRHLVFRRKIISVKMVDIPDFNKEIWYVEHMDKTGLSILYDLIKDDILIKEEEKDD